MLTKGDEDKNKENQMTEFMGFTCPTKDGLMIPGNNMFSFDALHIHHVFFTNVNLFSSYAG